MRKNILVIAVVLFISTIAQGQDSPTIADFALKRTIEIQESSPLHTFELPVDVYQTISSPLLNDLRIFNAAGTVIPFEITDIESTVQREVLTSTISFFPISGLRSSKADTNTEVKIKQDDKGAIVSVQFGQPTNSKLPTATSNTYLLDLRNFHRQIEALNFQWQSSEQMVPLTIESSNDLKNWKSVCSGVLANLNYLGQAISQNSINCYSGNGLFLRVSVPENTPFYVKQIDAVYKKTDTILPHPLTTKIQAMPTADNKKSFLYDSGGYLPIHAINLTFSEQNILTRLSISSRLSPEVPWINRLNTTMYHLRVNGSDLLSGFINLSTVISDRYWKIETQGKETVLSDPPVMEFRWLPHRVLFVAQGSSPFFLAYGNAQMKSLKYNNDNVASLSKSLSVPPTKATLSEPQQSAGNQALVPKKTSEPVQWKKWILWAVLAITLIIVLSMAGRLIKELKNK